MRFLSILVLLVSACGDDDASVDNSDVGDSGPGSEPADAGPAEPAEPPEPVDAPATDSVAELLTAGPDAVWPTDGWTEMEPADLGLDADKLEEARAYAFQDGKNTQGVVVTRHGIIAAEWYAEGKDKDSWVTSWSAGKSFASATLGVAMDEGLVPGGVGTSMAECASSMC